MKKEASESIVQIIVRDETVRRSCADFVIAVFGALTGKRSAATTPED